MFQNNILTLIKIVKNRMILQNMSIYDNSVNKFQHRNMFFFVFHYCIFQNVYRKYLHTEELLKFANNTHHSLLFCVYKKHLCMEIFLYYILIILYLSIADSGGTLKMEILMLYKLYVLLFCPLRLWQQNDENYMISEKIAQQNKF